MKYLVIHPLPAGLTEEALRDMAGQIKEQTNVRGYRSFLNLSEGKGACVFDAPDQRTLELFLADQGLSSDSIFQVEFEGQGTELTDLREKAEVSDTTEGLI